MRVFLAGATGAVGKPLLKQLMAAGHEVAATTRSAAKAEQLRRMGTTFFVLDGLDGAAIGEAVARAEPDAIIHQMTALSAKPDFRHFDSWFAQTNGPELYGLEQHARGRPHQDGG
jgi:2-alkyl-3-oxoalkanoate reductase